MTDHVEVETRDGQTIVVPLPGPTPEPEEPTSHAQRVERLLERIATAVEETNEKLDRIDEASQKAASAAKDQANTADRALRQAKARDRAPAKTR